MNFKTPTDLLEWLEMWPLWGAGDGPRQKRARPERSGTFVLRTAEARATWGHLGDYSRTQERGR